MAVHCGATFQYNWGSYRNCTCTLRTEQTGGPVSVNLRAQRLGVHNGAARFAPRSFDEALHGTFALWDVLDSMMRAYEPEYGYATGYVRELQLRRMVEIARDERSVGPHGEINYCEVGMNGAHSTVAMLLANPKLVAHVFDFMAWKYSAPIATLLKRRFGERFNLHPGSSHETLTPWAGAFAANGSRCQILFVDGDHAENGALKDVADLGPVAAPTSRLIMDDIAIGPGCSMRRMVRFGVLAVDETYGPFDAPSLHNPCMRTGGVGRRGNTRKSCVPWGFAVLRYTARGLQHPEAWPRKKRLGANRGARCFDLSKVGQVNDER